MRPSFLIGAIVVAIGVILGIQYWPVTEQPEPVQVEPPLPATRPLPPPAVVKPEPQPVLPVEIAPPPEPQPDTEPVVELPSLADSDAFVLAQIAPWSIPPRWLQREDLLARAAVVVQNAADGRVPRRQVAFMTPARAFQVTQEGERFFVDPASYSRYDSYVELLESIPPVELAEFVDLVAPLLGDALARLGERRKPAELIADAFERLDALPDVPSRIELLRPNVMYLYADETLEALPGFDKQVLRMGPRNISRLRAYIAEFKKFYLSK